MLSRIVPLSIAALMLAASGPATAWAVDCKSEVESAYKFLTTLESEVPAAREQNRPRIKAFMEQGRLLLEEGRIHCEKAEGKLDHAAALAKVALAQGHFAAARIFIRLD